MSRPTGQALRNWKKAEKRRLVREGKPIPSDWVAHWESVHGADTGKKREQGITVGQIPSADLTAEELIEDRRKRFRLRMAHEEACRLVPVTVHDSGPIGILHFGDPHLDDDGTDWDALMEHMRLVVDTPGLYAASIGDMTNNWIGRLARLYGQQSTTAREAWMLAEYMINFVGKKWLYLIGGNHDLWSGDADPVAWITRQIGATYQGSGIRLGLQFPNGCEVTVNARHDHPGSSQWNPAHAQMKQAQMGFRDDIIISGHKHLSGQGIIKDPVTGKVCHCLQVASYKRFDHYAKEKGFRDQSVSPCAMTVIDPDADPVGRVQVFWDARAGAEYLTLLRKRREVA